MIPIFILRRDLRPDAGGHWRPGLDDEARGSERIRASVPGARLITLAPAKHLGLIEHHERHAQAVREFTYATEAQMGRGAA